MSGSSKVPSGYPDSNLTIKQHLKLISYKHKIEKILEQMNDVDEENQYVLDITHGIYHLLEGIDDEHGLIDN